jgi:hypothetical protein
VTTNDFPAFPGGVSPALPAEITWEAVEQALACLGLDLTGLRGVGIDHARVHVTYLIKNKDGHTLTFDGQPAEVTFPIPITVRIADMPADAMCWQAGDPIYTSREFAETPCKSMKFHLNHPQRSNP